MIELWVGLALLFICVGVYCWSRNHVPDQRQEALRRYAIDVEADQQLGSRTEREKDNG
jgi:hypothetical protein